MMEEKHQVLPPLGAAEYAEGLPPQQLVAQAHQRKAELSVTRGISTVRAALELIAEQYNLGLARDSAKRIRI